MAKEWCRAHIRVTGGLRALGGGKWIAQSRRLSSHIRVLPHYYFRVAGGQVPLPVWPVPGKCRFRYPGYCWQ
ncbi:unnamed protein product [Caretta caretta]